jgi:hypothetical protein
MSSMRFAIIAVFVAGTALASHAATCTITAAAVPVASQHLIGIAGSLVGVQLPVTVNEAAGTLDVDFSSVAPAEFSLSGISSSITLASAGSVSGTIDGAGNVVLPNMLVAFTTEVTPEVISAPATLTSGVQAVTLTGTDYPTEGKAIDFVTGTLKVAGQAVLLNAPTVGQVTTGFELACTLAPVPSQDALPKGSSLVAKGTVKPGASDGSDVVGDTLTLKATVKLGATPLDPTQDVLVQVAVAGETALLLRVPAGGLTGGKKLVASDDGGSTIHVVTGRKSVGNNDAPVSGKLSVAVSKKKLTLKLTHTGGDLSALTGATSATVAVGVGPITVRDDVTVKPGKKKTTLK